MDTLADLTILADFEGTAVPECTPSNPLLAIFGPMLTHPSHITFPWQPLKRSLFSYFNSPPAGGLDPNLIYQGWSGLQLVITAFKRLELVENPDETREVVEWLHALKIATIKRSLAYEDKQVGTLQNILAGLHQPVDPATLSYPDRPLTRQPSAGSSCSFPKPGASTSFERGSVDGGIQDAHLHAVSPDKANDSTREDHVVASVLAQARHANVTFVDDPAMSSQHKKRAKPNGLMRKEVSNSAASFSVPASVAPPLLTANVQLSSFADFSDQPSLDMSGSEAASDTEDDPRKQQSSSQAYKLKVEALATKLMHVTKLGWSRCYALASRCTRYELEDMPLDDQDFDSTFDDDIPVAMGGAGPAGPPVPGFGGQHPIVANGSGPYAVGTQHHMQQSLPHHLNHYNQPRVAAPSSSSSQQGGIGGALNMSHGSTSSDLGKTASGRAQKGKKRVQRPHDPNRPAFSYSALIGQAILSTPDKRMRLAEIYDYVTEHYPYYKKNECGWQNSIRHNLSLQPVFIKVADMQSGKKGCFWTIQPGQEWRFEGGGWQKLDKKRGQAGSSKMRKIEDGLKQDYEDVDEEDD